MGKVIVVATEQYEAARAPMRISGGIDQVDPLIAKIAQAEPATAEQIRFAIKQ